MKCPLTTELDTMNGTTVEILEGVLGNIRCHSAKCSGILEKENTESDINKQLKQENWQLKVIMELIGENKTFKNSQEAFSSLNFDLLKSLYKYNLTQYEAAEKYIECIKSR